MLTGPGKLPFKAIIHVAGIDLLWCSSEEATRDSVRNALALAGQQGFGSIAFPLIGAGTGGGDSGRILEIMVKEATASDFKGEIRIVVFKGR